MLKRDPSKLEAVGYPKGTKGYLFYDPQEQKVIVSTNVWFLEEDNKPISKTILEELRSEGNANPIPLTEVNPSPVVSTQRQGEPRHSGRIVRQPKYFIGLGEVPKELETDSYNYNKAIQDKDVTL